MLETKKVARILEVAKKLPSNLHVESPRDGGRGDCSIKLCLESLRSEVQSLTLCIPFLTRGTPFVYLPLKNCTLFTYLLHENKSIRKVVFRSFSSNLQLNFHENDITTRRVSSKHFNKRCTCPSIACFSRIAVSGVVVFHVLRFSENPVEKSIENVLSGRSTISKRTGNAAGMFQKEISFVSKFLLKKLILMA